MVRFKTKPQRSLKKEEQSDPNPKHSILIVNTNKSQNERKEVKEPSPKVLYRCIRFNLGKEILQTQFHPRTQFSVHFLYHSKTTY